MAVLLIVIPGVSVAAICVMFRDRYIHTALPSCFTDQSIELPDRRVLVVRPIVAKQAHMVFMELNVSARLEASAHTQINNKKQVF